MTDVREIKSIMTRQEISQKELAQRMHMSTTTMNSRLNNKSSFDLDEVERLCNILSIKDPDEKGRIFLP